MSQLTRQALIHVTPRPTTLRESTAILNHLQRFGLVSALLNPRYLPTLPKPSDESSTLLIVFDLPSSLDSALAESPVTVYTPVEPDPKEVDPFNLRGYHSRKRFLQRTFTCEILRDEDPTRHAQLSKSSRFHGGFKFGAGQKGGLVEDMRGQGLGRDLIGIAGILSSGNSEIASRPEGASETEIRRRKPGLMNHWREVQQRMEGASAPAEVESICDQI